MKKRRKYRIRTRRLEEMAILSAFLLIGSVGAFETYKIGVWQFLAQCAFFLGTFLASALTLYAREAEGRR